MLEDDHSKECGNYIAKNSPNSLIKYIKAWAKFRLLQENPEFKTRIQSKQEYLIYFRYIRTEKGMVSSTMWSLEYIQHDKFNHQGKIWIVFEVFPQNN